MNKTAEEIYQYLENEESSIGIREHNQRMYDCRQAYNKGFAAAQFAASPQPDAGGEMAELKKPFRIGRKQKRAILDAEGQFVGVFSPGNENAAKMFCDWANGATLPTREPEVKEKFAIRFSEWLMIQCDYKNHCVWEYQGEEYTQQELIEIFKHTTPSRPANKSVNN